MAAKIQLGDIDVCFTEAGGGAPVVMVHGLAEDHCSWSYVQQKLAGYRTYAYDVRGHGGSGLGKADGTLVQLGNDLIRFLETVSGPAQCVGYSMGGAIVLWTANQRPDLVRHGVVIGTTSMVGRAAADFFAMRIEQAQSDWAAFETGFYADTKAQIVNPDVDIRAIAARRLITVGDGGGYVNGARAMATLRGHPLTPILPALNCPVDVIAGSDDQFCPRKAADIMVAALKNGTFQEIPEAGHMMSVDQPDLYVESIENALARARTERDRNV